MEREKKLVKNTVILAMGKIFTQLITFLLLPLYTTILTTEEYGIVDLLNTLVALLLPILTFQVEQAVFRNLIGIRDDEKEKKKIISVGIFSVFLQCMIYLLFCMIISPLIHNEYKIFLATNVVAYIFGSLLQQIARGLGDNKQFAIGSFISAIATIITNILFLVIIKLGANGMLLANMIGQFVCAIYLFFVLKLYNYISLKEFKYEILKKLWRYSIPLIPNAISWWIFDASDKVIVSAILGVEMNGILSVAHKFSTVYITLYNIFRMSWTEMISIHIDDDDFECFFNQIFNTILKIFVSIGIGVIVFMPVIYPIMINEKFYEGFYQIPIMLVSSIFNVLIGLVGAIYIAKKNTKAVANTSIFVAIINIVIHLALIKYIGLYAATISTCIAFFIMGVYRLYDIKKRYFTIIIEGKFIFYTIIILIIIVPIYYLENFILNVIGILCTIIYLYIVNKNSIYLVFQFIKNKVKLYK